MSLAQLPYIFCTVFVVSYAWDQFNIPQSNRSSTTAFNYYCAATCYVVVIVALYFALALSPEFVMFLAQLHLDADMIGIADTVMPYLAALCLTIYLEKITFLHRVVDSLRKKLQSLANIPLEAIYLGEDLLKAEFAVSENEDDPVNQKKIKDLLRGKGFEEEDIVFTNNESPQYIWTKISALMELVRTLRSKRPYGPFSAAFTGEITNLTTRYNGLIETAKGCFILNNIRSDNLNKNVRRAVAALVKDFEEQSKELLEHLCLFIGRSVLHTHLTHGSRWKELRQMGFTPAVDLEPPAVDLNSLSFLFIAIFSVMLCSLMVVGTRYPTLRAIVVMASMIASMYLIGVFAPHTRKPAA